ncbi:hypothetical protein [Breoghania sp.]|uniref:hypothetical protein n=1 Tax=Breoghania sp. TaxID=2065378 RepID=UPI002618F58E|nr:hypothetical protein [Breoghania sp.]MDJ0930386.1 hypothetical protein [Breoghania sp.]
MRGKELTAPVIVLVIPAERGQLPALRAAGFDTYLVKPVRSVSLIKVVAALIAGEPVGDGEASWRDESGASPLSRPGRFAFSWPKTMTSI